MVIIYANSLRIIVNLNKEVFLIVFTLSVFSNKGKIFLEWICLGRLNSVPWEMNVYLYKIILGMMLGLALSIPVYAEQAVTEAIDSDVDSASRDKFLAQEKELSSELMRSNVKRRHSKQPPLKPYPRLLPLTIESPATVQVGEPQEGITVQLVNPGKAAPNARLRIIIHDKDHRHHSELPALSPDNVKLELLENGKWKNVELGIMEGSVMGAIGREGSSSYRERHKRGGFLVRAGKKKTWHLRLTMGVPGTYSLVAAVSPDNGSRHIAKPAHTVIVVQ